MAQNSKQSKLSEKGDECTFTWKVFASWDTGSPMWRRRTIRLGLIFGAHLGYAFIWLAVQLQVASIVMGFREALVEEMEKEKLGDRDWKVNLNKLCAKCHITYKVLFLIIRLLQKESAPT